MINFNGIGKENTKVDDLKWPQILDYFYRILTFSGLTSGKTNLKSHQQNTDEIYLYAKDLNEPKYQLLMKKHERTGIKNFKNFKTFIRRSNYIKIVYLNIYDYNPSKKHKIFFLFEIMIANMLNNKKLELLITESFIKSRKIDTSIVFKTKSYFADPKMLD